VKQKLCIGDETILVDLEDGEEITDVPRVYIYRYKN
jgi:hypothetical protein